MTEPAPITAARVTNLMRDPRYWRDRDPAFVDLAKDAMAALYPDRIEDPALIARFEALERDAPVLDAAAADLHPAVAAKLLADEDGRAALVKRGFLPAS